jgi:hypothetical protein
MKKSANKSEAPYEIAVNIITAQGNLIWSLFTSQSQVHAIFIALCGLFLTVPHASPLIITAISMLGILLCLIWIITLRRQFGYFEYYMAHARALEEEIYGDSVAIIRTGRALSDGESIYVRANSQPMIMAGLKQVKVKTLMTSSIVVFAAIYGVMLAVSIPRIGG